MHGDLLLAAPHHLSLSARRPFRELTEPNPSNKQLHADYIKVSVYYNDVARFAASEIDRYTDSRRHPVQSAVALFPAGNEKQRVRSARSTSNLRVYGPVDVLVRELNNYALVTKKTAKFYQHEKHAQTE